MNGIEKGESTNDTVNETVNADFLNLNKVENHTLENDIKKYMVKLLTIFFNNKVRILINITI